MSIGMWLGSRYIFFDLEALGVLYMLCGQRKGQRATIFRSIAMLEIWGCVLCSSCGLVIFLLGSGLDGEIDVSSPCTIYSGMEQRYKTLTPEQKSDKTTYQPKLLNKHDIDK
jgi:hypothetical protein